MARNKQNYTSSIIANEIILEGPSSNTAARVTFEANKLKFQNTKTGENLLFIDSSDNQVSFGVPIKLPDGTLLNTVSDVSVRDFEVRASIPVVIYDASGNPKNENEPIVITAILTGLRDSFANFTTNPSVELAGTGNTRYLYPNSFLENDSIEIIATADEFSETITIKKITEGADGITIAITNPSDVISADFDGKTYQADLDNTQGKFSLYKGATNLTDLEKVLYRVDDIVNISIDIDPVTGIYRVTSFDQNADKGSATLVALYSGTEYTHTYRIVKAKAGQPGQNGSAGAAGQDGESPYIGIVSDENVFIDTINNDNVANINPSAIDINNVLIATQGVFEIYKGTNLQTNGVLYCVGESGTNTSEVKNNLTFFIDSSTGTYHASVVTAIVQETNGWKTENETFTIRALIDGITISTRKIKIQKTKIGKDGKTGPSLNLNVSPALFKFDGEGVPVPNQNLTITTLSSNLPEGATIEINSVPALTFQNSNENKILSVDDFKDSEGKYLDSAVIKAQVYVGSELYVEDFVTIFRTQNGTDAKSIVLSSESQVFNFSDSDSINPENLSVLVNIKTQNLTEAIGISDLQVTKNNSTSISLLSGDLVDNGDDSYTLTINFNSLGITSKETRDAAFPLKIRVDKQEVFDIISIHKLTGGDGALSGYLTNESDQIPAFADGTTQEQDYSTLNGNFKIFKGLEEVTDQCTFEVTFNENMVTTVNSNGFYSVNQGSMPNSSNTGRAVIQASLGESQRVQKVFTVTKNKQGKNTLNAILSNETHTVRAESNGELVALSDLNSAGGVAVLYDGNERQTSGVSFSVLQGDDTSTTSDSFYTTPSGLKLSINSSTGAYIVSTTNTTSWTGNTETFYIKIEYNTSIIIKSYTITKSKGGADAKLMTLRSNRLVFTFDSDNNASPSGQEIIFTANPTKGSTPLNTPITWSVTPDNATNRALLKDLNPVDSKKKRILIEDFRTANIQDLQITAESDALEDSITIVKAKDGSSGEDAKTVKVSATSMVIAYDTDEDTTATPNSITVFISQQNLSTVLGTSDVTITKSDNSTVNPSSIDSSGVNSGTKTGESFFTISIGETQADLISKSDLPIEIKVESSSDGVKDVLTINRISGGANGIDGANAVTAFLTNESHTAPAESNGFVSNDVLGDAGGSYELYDGLTKIINSTGTTDSVIFSVVGGNVSNGVSYLEVQGLRIEVNQSTGIYSLSNDLNTSWSRNYQVFTLRAVYNNLEFDKKYTLSKSKEGQAGAKGDSGISPVNGVLTNESHTVVAAFDGTVSSLAGSGGTFRVYRGQTEITQTNDVSFSVVGTQPQNGLSISINNTTGTTKGEYSLSQTSWTSDSETFILQAVVDTTTVIQKAFTITKSKAGKNGEPAKYILLEATKQSFDKNYQGDTSVFNPTSQTITFTANRYNFSSNPTVEWYVDGNLVSDTSVLTDNGDGTAKMSQSQFETATNNLTNLSTTVKYREVVNNIPYSDQVTVILSQQGKDGSSGRDAKVVSLVADDYQVAFTPNGESWSKEPSQINLEATAKNQDQTATIKYYFYINSARQNRADETINTFTISDIESTPDTFVKRNVKVELVEEINGVEKVVATDTVTIFATKEGRDGEPAVTISMPNNNHTFPASALGVVTETDYITGTTDIEVYIGNTQVQPVPTTMADSDMPNNRFKISNVMATNITAGGLSSASINGLVLTTAAPSSMTQKTASLEFEIKVKDENGNIKTFIQKQSFTRSDKGTDGVDGVDGAPGVDGANAKALFLQSDAQNFFLDKSGVVINDTINFSVIKENISGDVNYIFEPDDVVLEYASEEEDNETFLTNSPWIKWEHPNGTGTNTEPNNFSWSPNQYLFSQINYFPTQYVGIKRNISANEKIEYISFEVVPNINNGQVNGNVYVNGALRSAYEDNGTEREYISFGNTTTPRRYRVLLSDLVGQNYTIMLSFRVGNQYSGFYVVDYYPRIDNIISYKRTTPILSYTNFSPNTSLKVTATATEPVTNTTEEQTYTSSITIGKIQSGTDGTDSKTVKLESDDYQIAYDASGKNPTTNTGNPYITLTATEQNHNSVNYKFYKKQSSATDFEEIPQNNSNGDTVSTRRFYLPTTKFNQPIRFKVETREGANTTVISTDSITVIGTKDGESAFNIAIENDNHTFPSDEVGNISVSDYNLGLTNIEVYYGNTPLTAVEKPIDGAAGLLVDQFYVEKIDSNITSVLSNSDTKYQITSLSNMTADSAIITLTIVAKGPAGDGVTFVKYVTYSKSKKGIDGTDERIYNFSKTVTINNIVKPLGWISFNTNDSRYFDWYKTYTGSQGYLGQSLNNGQDINILTVVSDSSSISGGNVLKWNLATANQWYAISDFIPIDVTKTYRFSTRMRQINSNSGYPRSYVVYFDENKNWINNNRYFMFSNTNTDWQENEVLISGISTTPDGSKVLTDTTRTIPSSAKYIRILLIFKSPSSDNNNTVFCDYVFFKEATANLDSAGRTPEINSSTNKPKILKIGDAPPANPTEGDLISIIGNDNFVGKTYIYGKKEYAFYETQNSSTKTYYYGNDDSFPDNGPARNTSWDYTLKNTFTIQDSQPTVGSTDFNTSSVGLCSYWYTYDANSEKKSARGLFIGNQRKINSTDYFYGTAKFTINYILVEKSDSVAYKAAGWYAPYPQNSNASSFTNTVLTFPYKANETVQNNTDILWYGTSQITVGDQNSIHYAQFTKNISDKNYFYQWTLTSNLSGDGYAILIHSILVEGWVPYIDEDVNYKLREIEQNISDFNFSFTGQHKCVSDSPDIKLEIGLIVSSVGFYDNVNYQNSQFENKILPIEAIPKVKLTQKEKDKSVFGVIAGSYIADSNSNLFSSDGKRSDTIIVETESGAIGRQREFKTRYEVNSIGEGGIWVTNYNGNLENGDYITSSPIPGHGMKQDDDILRNYTVAKITCDCDFNLENQIYDCIEFEWEGQIYRKAFVGCTYHCG